MVQILAPRWKHLHSGANVCTVVLILPPWWKCFHASTSPYLPLLTENCDIDDAITEYFGLGFSYNEIGLFLATYHNARVSSRTSTRKLRLSSTVQWSNNQLQKPTSLREPAVMLATVLDAIEQDLQNL